MPFFYLVKKSPLDGYTVGMGSLTAAAPIHSENSKLCEYPNFHLETHCTHIFTTVNIVAAGME